MKTVKVQIVNDFAIRLFDPVTTERIYRALMKNKHADNIVWVGDEIDFKQGTKR